MVLKSPVKICTVGHKEKSLSVIGFLAGRIQRLFISFGKKKTCNYCILTPRQAITSQKLSPGNQTLAWLIRLTSLANALLQHRAARTPRTTLPVTGAAVALRWVVLCFLLLSFMCSLKPNPFPEIGSHQKEGAPGQTDRLYCTRRRKLEKRKKERKATKVVNSSPRRKSFSALYENGLLFQPFRHVSYPLLSLHILGVDFCLGFRRLRMF